MYMYRDAVYVYSRYIRFRCTVQSDVYKCTLGWSGLTLFSIFENLHLSADQIYFYEFNKTKWQFWLRACSSHARQSILASPKKD